jgi:hypothetical protein
MINVLRGKPRECALKRAGETHAKGIIIHALTCADEHGEPTLAAECTLQPQLWQMDAAQVGL